MKKKIAERMKEEEDKRRADAKEAARLQKIAEERAVKQQAANEKRKAKEAARQKKIADTEAAKAARKKTQAPKGFLGLGIDLYGWQIYTISSRSVWKFAYEDFPQSLD